MKYEIFPGVYTNQQQTKAIDTFKRFLTSDKRVATLKGRGGTGKTTVVGKIFEDERDVLFLAPTHQAKQLLKKAANGRPVMTVSAALFITLDNNTGKFKPDLYRRKREIMPIQKFKYVVIDEASMLSDPVIEELAKFLPKDSKLLLMGDNCQLPPVGQPHDSKSFKYVVYELTERMRQVKGSPILEFSDHYVKNIESGSIKRQCISPEMRVTNFNPDTNEGIVFEKDFLNMLEMWKEDYLKDSVGTKIITYNNHKHPNKLSVKRLNEMARSIVKPNAELPYEEGEILLSYSSFDGELIANSAQYIVERANKVTDVTRSARVYSKKKGIRRFKFDVEGQWLVIKDITEGKKIYEFVPTFEGNLYIQSIVQGMMTGTGINLATNKTFEQDIQLALKVEDLFPEFYHAYAITAHKAQGATMRNVYVMEDNIIDSNISDKEVNQALYVAVTRPTSKLVMFSKTNLL